jgi:hypothetical protein
MDRLHVQRMAERECDALRGAQIGQPVLGEDALHADDQIVSIRRDALQKGLRRGLHVLVQHDLAVLVQDAHVHRPRVQIDPAGVPVPLGVESHPIPPVSGWVLVTHPAYRAFR